MPLPSVAGWIIDFRAARAVFGSNDNFKTAYLADLSSNKTLFACHTEYDRFKGHPQVSAAIGNTIKRIIPNQDVLEKCVALENIFHPKELLGSDKTPLYIGAAAASNNYGVISNHSSPVFLTVADVCDYYCVHVFTVSRFFNSI